MTAFLLTAAFTALAVFALAVVLSVLPLLGRPGRAVTDAFTRPPLLDIILAILTAAPWAVALAWKGWIGLPAAVLGQMAAVYAWIVFHELLYLRSARGPRIVHFTNRLVGRPANHLALWLTTFGVPVLWVIRALEIFIYPTLIWLLRFPRYRHADWVTLSRHKFRDLVGHDLVWCLYCDWMTGTWSLGTEMLRNVESFWCPIRFAHEVKIQNCQSNFPDVNGGWVPADGTMADVQAALEKQYPGPGDRSWFGHPARLPDSAAPAAPAVVPELDDLYRETLQDHSAHPRNCRAMPDATHRAEGELPLCNDRIAIFLKRDNGRIADISFLGQACPICTASASLMTQRLAGRTVDEARQIFASFHDLMLRPAVAGAEDLGDLQALAGLHRFPARVKCATLPWHTLMAAIEYASAADPSTASPPPSSGQTAS